MICLVGNARRYGSNHLSFVLLVTVVAWCPELLFADSINSPNITMNVDTNRSSGNGAGNVAVTVNTITVAETTLAEYSSGAGRSFSIAVQPGYQFDSSSPISAVSTTMGFNGLGVNTAATLTPSGSEDEVLTFNLTSGTSTSTQDILRITGIKLKIASVAGAAGPAQSTMSVTTSAAGGAFVAQSIVAASIQRGVADRLVFAVQPGSNEAGVSLLPSVKLVDFGGNLIQNDDRTISLSLGENPGSTSLQGTLSLDMEGGIAEWTDTEALRVNTSANDYTLLAEQGGDALQSDDQVESDPFSISVGDPGGLEITTQPTDVEAEEDILFAVQVVDEFGNPTNTSGVSVTIDSAANPLGWPLLVDTSLTKTTENGVVEWGEDDNLRILKAVTDYSLSASGLGTPVESDLFDVNPGSAALLRFTSHPETTSVDEPFDPSVSVEVTDRFSNRVDTSEPVGLEIADTDCGASLTGENEPAESGEATFSSLSVGDSCDDISFVASAQSNGIVGALSDSFDVKAANSFPVSIRSLKLKPKKFFRFAAGGTFTLSKKPIDDPRKKGANLIVTGSEDTIRIPLPKRGWSRPRRGVFVFKGRSCQSIVVKRNSVVAQCRTRLASLELPEDEVSVVLSLGKGTEEFCGVCGGTTEGDETKIFKRSDCEAPEFCS